MIARLKKPFPSIPIGSFMSRGSTGQIFAITPEIVLKCPTIFHNPAPQQEMEMEDSKRRIENEKSVYRLLQKNRHPHIVDCIRLIPEGIILSRESTTLENRLRDHATISDSLQNQWLQQLISALAWLETLDLAHGDLRPANVLLDRNDNIRLGDFDACVRYGNQLQVASEPYCKLNRDRKLPVGGSGTEQFAYGSCMFFIRVGLQPWHELDPPRRVQKLMRNEFPPVHDNTLFGDIMENCWHENYDSLASLEQEICRRLDVQSSKVQQVDQDRLNLLHIECDDFLKGVSQ